MPSSSEFWTDEREATLREMWAKGDSGTIIGDAVGTSRSAVIGKAHRLHLGGRRTLKRIQMVKRRPVLPPRPPKVQKVKPVFGPDADVLAALRAQPDAAPKVLSVQDLEAHHCKWPIGDSKEPGFGFCGQRREPGTPYCRCHAAKAYVAVERKGIKPTAWTTKYEMQNRSRFRSPQPA